MILHTAKSTQVSNAAHIEHTFFILLSGSIMKSGLYSSSFFTILSTLFFSSDSCLYGH